MSLHTFNEFCKNLYQSAEKLEDELETNVNVSQDLILKSETIDVKLPLQKVKIYHYSEIIQLIKSIKSDIKKILYHEQCISKLESTKKLSGEEVQHYFSAENINQEPPSNKLAFIRRERRRAASEVSLYTLSTWEAYLKKKEDADISEATVQTVDVPKRNQPGSKRKQKKFVSSTFNDILENDVLGDRYNIDSKCISIVEENEDVIEEGDYMDMSKRFLSYSAHNLLGAEFQDNKNGGLRSCLSVEHFEDTKPRIVDIVYKKTPDVSQDVRDWNNIHTSFYPDSG